MASSSLVPMLPLLLLLVCPDVAVSAAAPVGASCYTRLFSFGDSITDAGNLASLLPNIFVMAPPYGETFFGRPTGRFCDGRLIVDFIAEALRLPFLAPYLTGRTANDFQQGVNFAVASATALRQDFFRDMGLNLTTLTPYSLEVQLEWFKRVLHLLGPTEQERKDIMSRSLFLMGEIGANDYNYPFFQNRSFTAEIKPLVPKVVQKIESAVKVLIGLGAKTIVVPGNVPMGCIPRYLAKFRSSNPGDYDAAGCLRWLNDFAELHNRALKRVLEQIPRDPTTVTVIYGDYYGAILDITRNPPKHGFTNLAACCGDGGPYNSGSLYPCNATSIVCPDPSKRISWDGIHYTEAVYRFVARGVLDGPYAAPSPILSKCRC
ncbi:GDSL esterase/lipase At1g31550-like [Phragmites australis]|uniref:GDSL esterase/lipase At1g31550-like n=1 Tax=Phragmites australis TaxID=29695 RepID=UPI002D79CB0B|nr:GDSL esterase/lipase At1g31550-like [Phragmites australis]